MHEKSLANSSATDLIAAARAHAPFYRSFYEGLPASAALADVPVLNPELYWLAHSRDRQEVLTAVQQDGYVLNSSGTSGPPKYSYVTSQEWDASIGLSARSFDEAGLRNGDRIATLFATGNMYASQLFATASFERMRVKVLQFPIGYWVPFADAAKIIEAFRINVLAGAPSHMLRVIDAIDKDSGVEIDHLIYAGEIFTRGQQETLRARFPRVQIHSAGYATVEGGAIAYADATCLGSEHRVYQGGTILEILDEETDEPILETGRTGRAVFTSLVRRLMPLIRYPTGDLARWTEPPETPNRKFTLEGRAGQAVRVAVYNLALSEVLDWLGPLRESLQVEHVQFVLDRVETADRLTFRLVGHGAPERLLEGSTRILQSLRERRPDLEKGIAIGMLAEPRVEWVEHRALTVSERSGKILPVVDQRPK